MTSCCCSNSRWISAKDSIFVDSAMASSCSELNDENNEWKRHTSFSAEYLSKLPSSVVTSSAVAPRASKIAWRSPAGTRTRRSNAATLSDSAWV